MNFELSLWDYAKKHVKRLSSINSISLTFLNDIFYERKFPKDLYIENSIECQFLIIMIRLICINNDIIISKIILFKDFYQQIPLRIREEFIEKCFEYLNY